MDLYNARENYISWDEYFMGVAILASQRSKDPSTQVGACIAGIDNRILSVGYNGAPNGIKDKNFNWGREGGFIYTKYAYVVHAEANAILNYKGSHKDFEGATLFSTLYPCNECAKLIIQSGIKKVVYLSNKYYDSEATIAARNIFYLAGITVSPYNGCDVTIELTATETNGRKEDNKTEILCKKIQENTDTKMSFEDMLQLEHRDFCRWKCKYFQAEEKCQCCQVGNYIRYIRDCNFSET